MFFSDHSEIYNLPSFLFDRQSYDIHITAVIDESAFKSGNTLDLKNPFFR